MLLRMLVCPYRSHSRSKRQDNREIAPPHSMTSPAPQRWLAVRVGRPTAPRQRGSSACSTARKQDSARQVASQTILDRNWGPLRDGRNSLPSYAEWSGSRGWSSNAYAVTGLTPGAVRRCVLPPADSVREHRRAEAAPGGSWRARQCRH
jgi:hypothetical protein